jgi:serine/threonine-protein kinase
LGLAKNPADRPASASAFLAELEEVALATYGPGWEERGRVRLAALAALLASLFPLAGMEPEASTALALTRLGRRRLAMVTGALVAAVVTGGGGAVVLAGVHHGLGAGTSATSSPVAAPAPSTPAPDSPSPSPSPSTPATPPDTTPPPTTAPMVTPTAASDPTSPAARTTAPVIPKIPPTKVSTLQATLTLSGTVGVADVTFTVSGPGKVVVSATFFSDAAPTAAAPTAAAPAPGVTYIQTVSGEGPHDVSFKHDYQNRCPAARVEVTTSRGGSSDATADCKGVG